MSRRMVEACEKCNGRILHTVLTRSPGIHIKTCRKCGRSTRDGEVTNEGNMNQQNTTMATVFSEEELNELACKFSAKPTVEIKLNDLQALRRALMHNIKQGNELLVVVNNLLGIDNNQ